MAVEVRPILPKAVDGAGRSLTPIFGLSRDYRGPVISGDELSMRFGPDELDRTL